MNGLLRRLTKLESAARLMDGPLSWPARVAEVNRLALEAMPPSEQLILRELFDSPTSAGLNNFVAANPEVWARYREAFDRATQEVPAPYVMTTDDRWA